MRNAGEIPGSRPASQSGGTRKKRLGVYIHYPFCVRKCAYCDFLSAPGSDLVREAYLAALCREIREMEHVFRNAEIRSVFIGGGTPSLMSPEDFIRLSDTLHDAASDWEPDAEWTIEANPGTVTPEKARCWKAQGVNRVSMGMQAAQNGLLKRIGRIHTMDDVRKSFEMLRDAGFDNLSLDLMMGLPGQSREDWQETLEEALVLQPEHLSCYSLIVEEGTPLLDWIESGRMTLPDEETERSMYDDTLKILRAAGFEQYEISNFAKPGRESRHNLSYWDLSEYLGLGLGASSYIDGKRIKNTADLQSYIKAEYPAELAEVEETLTPEDKMSEWMFLGLRKTAGVSDMDFAEKFGRSFTEVYPDQIRQLVHDGLLEQKGDRLRLTRRGLDLANIVFEAFI